MATRQRARSSTPKTTASTSDNQASGTQEVTPARRRRKPAPTDLPAPNADIPGITANDAVATEVKFVGEQLSYKSRYERIAESAYAYAEARGFAPGGEFDDWLRAEREVDALLAGLDLEHRVD